MSVLCSIPHFGYPKQLPGVSEIKANKVDESVDRSTEKDLTLFVAMKLLGNGFNEP